MVLRYQVLKSKYDPPFIDSSLDKLQKVIYDENLYHLSDYRGALYNVLISCSIVVSRGFQQKSIDHLKSSKKVC